MIIVYAFVAFLFFKIFPEFAGYRSNTVVGALLMAAASAIVLKATELAAYWRIGVWIQSERTSDTDGPTGLLLIALAGIAVSMAVTFLVGVGFSGGLMRDAFKGFRPDPSMFWAMAAIPPLCHVALRAPAFRAAIAAAKEGRRSENLKID
jgi:hypothetical protein